MDKQQYYDGKDPRLVTPVICLNCRKEWMAVHPLDVKVEQLECPGCEEQRIRGRRHVRESEKLFEDKARTEKENRIFESSSAVY